MPSMSETSEPRAVLDFEKIAISPLRSNTACSICSRRISPCVRADAITSANGDLLLPRRDGKRHALLAIDTLFTSMTTLPHRAGRSCPRGRSIISAALAGSLATASGCMLAGPSHSRIDSAPMDLQAQNVSFHSASGSDIHAWFIRGQPRAGAVLLLHGVGANRTAMLGRARFLHGLGFTVLAPDFQAHGESSGDHVTFGARESLDAAASLDFLRRVIPGERVGVIGVSMGGAAALLGPGPLPANAFVLESVYPTIRQALSNRLDTWLGPFGGVARLFTPVVLHLVGNDIGVSETDLKPIDRIARLHAPLLLISGTLDPYTPIAEAESLYAHAPSPKSYWAVDGAGHEDLHAYDRVEYERRVSNFLQKSLRSPETDSTWR